MFTKNYLILSQYQVFANYEAAYSYAGKLNTITQLDKQEYV